MRLLVFTLLLAAISVSLVQSRCMNILNRSPSKAKCEDWWKQAQRYYYTEGSAIRRCITLIQNKCSGLINIEKSVTHEVRNDYIEWTIKVSGHSPGYPSVGAAYTTQVTTKLCEKDDKGLGTCDLWWNNASKRSSENYIVKKCIAVITKHCPDDIKRLSETKEEVKSSWRRQYAFTRVYQYKDGSQLQYKL